MAHLSKKENITLIAISSFVLTALLTVIVASVTFGNTGIRVGAETAVLRNGPGKGIQATPSVAWGGGVYLVVWREGWHGERGQAHIFAARVKTDGTLLDPEGIEVSRSGKGVQAYPRIAFAKGTFLVVWQDTRRQNDMDVLAARLSTEGKIIDDAPVIIDQSQHSQALPDVASDEEGFWVAWQSFDEHRAEYVGRSIRVRADGSTGKRLDIGAPCPRIASIGEKSLLVYGAQNLYSQLLYKNEKLTHESLLARCHKTSIFSLTGAPGKGWLVVNHRSPPDNWGWGGPGAMRCYFIRLDGRLDPELNPSLKQDRAGNWSKLPNWLDIGIKKDNSLRTWPYGNSAITWDGRQFVVIWQRHHFKKKVPFHNTDLVAARVDGWKPLDQDPIPVAAGPSDERCPALASDGAGGVLCAYEKCEPDGGVSIYVRLLQTY